MDHNSNLYSHFRCNFPSDLDTILLINEEGRRTSYRDAEVASAKLANLFLNLGLTVGDRVTVQVEKSVESLFVYLACLRSGLVYHPLNTAYRPAELEYFVADAGPSLIICESESKEFFQEITSVIYRDVANPIANILTLNADGSGSLMPSMVGVSSDHKVTSMVGTDMAALLYSSGTTGQPKGIMLSHDNLRSNAQTLISAWGFSSSDRLLHMLPIYHVHGLFVGLGCVLMSGASMHWCRSFSDQTAIAALPSCTVMMGVPTYYTRLLSNPDFDLKCCKTMRLFISGSAPLLSDTFAEFRDRSGHSILERYGMTETGMNTSNPLDGERLAGTVGMPLAGVKVRVVDEALSPVALGDTGDLQVKGPNVFIGYWGKPQKTNEDFTPDGYFNTGDKASINEKGYVSIVGRAKDMIISGGLNVYPKEVELVIDELDGVVESAVIGLPDSDFGEVVVAIIVKSGGLTSEKTVIQHCRSLMASYKCPKKVIAVEALPRNAMGKVQKNKLRHRFS